MSASAARLLLDQEVDLPAITPPLISGLAGKTVRKCGTSRDGDQCQN